MPDICSDDRGSRLFKSSKGRNGVRGAQGAHFIEEENKVSSEAKKLRRTDSPKMRTNVSNFCNTQSEER